MRKLDWKVRPLFKPSSVNHLKTAGLFLVFIVLTLAVWWVLVSL